MPGQGGRGGKKENLGEGGEVEACPGRPEQAIVAVQLCRLRAEGIGLSPFLFFFAGLW